MKSFTFFINQLQIKDYAEIYGQQIDLEICRTGSTFAFIYLITRLIVPVKIKACHTDGSFHGCKIIDEYRDTGCYTDIQVMFQLV